MSNIMAQTPDQSVSRHIEELVAEKTTMALREFGKGPDEAEVRPEKTAENYSG